ncbi:MAG: alanine--tRNA ligase [Patescibacteria group bacterium]|nr:alanine--tRNA ligase [Patescibacteria group bacterium]
MTANELRNLFLQYFEKRGHKVIPSASLVPENDPTALFTSAGMQPLVPYLIGETHPAGKKLASVQKCIRTDDIDEVGDKVHHTFFEMLGNWSLGDYFKKETIEMSYEFLTDKKWLGLDKEKLAVSVFAGDDDAPFDQEAYDKWIGLGISIKRIAKLPKKNNWWGPGESGPCGPDTEMFYWTGSEPAPDKFDDKNANWVEIWNDVFMQYQLKEGKYTPLAQKNVDTGMGLERMLAVLNGFDDNYKTELFWPILNKISDLSGKPYEGNEKAFRIIADHIKAAVFAISDGVFPSNKGAGYVVRRLLRKAILNMHRLGIYERMRHTLEGVTVNGVTSKNILLHVFLPIIKSIYENEYYVYIKQISPVINKEEERFLELLDNSEKYLKKAKPKIEKFIASGQKSEKTGHVTRDLKYLGEIAFDLYQQEGIPPEISYKYFQGITGEPEDWYYEFFEQAMRKHQELSRTASAGMFKGGLADAGEVAVKYHTTTHLLHQALRQVLGDHVQQKGSNINAERLRFDFTHTDKMTPEQISEVEKIVNKQIEKDLPVTMEEMTVEEAKQSGAIGLFEHKYGDRVKVYTIGLSDNYFSREICGGPHVENIGTLGHFKIKKEESSSAGIRRIKAVLE